MSNINLNFQVSSVEIHGNDINIHVSFDINGHFITQTISAPINLEFNSDVTQVEGKCPICKGTAYTTLSRAFRLGGTYCEWHEDEEVKWHDTLETA